MTINPHITTTHCKNCKAPLSVRILELINDPRSTNWVKEGYCSVICYRQQQYKQPNQSQPLIDTSLSDHSNQTTPDTITLKSTFVQESVNIQFNNPQIEQWSSQLIYTISMLEKGKNKAYLIQYLKEEAGIVEMSTIKFILQVAQLIKKEKLIYLDDIRRIITWETDDARAYEKIRKLLKNNEVSHDLVEFVLYAACYSIDQEEIKRLDKKNRNRPNTINYLLLFWGVSWTFIGVLAISMYGVQIELLLAFAMGILCVIGGLSRKFRE